MDRVEFVGDVAAPDLRTKPVTILNAGAQVEQGIAGDCVKGLVTERCIGAAAVERACSDEAVEPRSERHVILRVTGKLPFGCAREPFAFDVDWLAERRIGKEALVDP